MLTEVLKRIFRPRGVAILAPSTPGEAVPRLARNIAEGGYRGRIVLLGEGPSPPPPFERYSSSAEAGPDLDLALVVDEVQGLALSLPALGSAGVQAVVAYGPSPPGEAWRASLSLAARTAGVRLVGPGSWGVVNTAVGLVAAQERPSLRQGGLALVTQSGTVCSYCLAEGAQRGLGWGLVLDLGAEVDLSQDEVIDYLATHYQAKVLMLHLGRMRRPASFMSAASAAARLKPVAAINSGKYASRVPTPALDALPEPSPREAWDAALNRAGVLCMDSLDELLSFGELAERWQECRGPRLLVVSASAEAGKLGMDATCRHGLALAKLDEDTRLLLAALGCQVDEQGLVLLEPAVDEAAFQTAATTCLQAPGVDAVLMVLAHCRGLEPANLVQTLRLASAHGQAGAGRVLVLAVWPGEARPASPGPPNESLAVFATLERAVEAYAGLWRHTEIMRAAKQVPRKPLGRFQLDRSAACRLLEDALGHGRSTLSPGERQELFEAYRLPVLPFRVVHSPGEVQRACEEWGYPARLLLTPLPSPGSDNLPELTALLDSAFQIQKQWRALHQKASRQGLASQEALVQPWPSTAEPSLMMGWHRHPQLGTLLMFGEGGERPGVLRDRSWGLPPLNRALAQALMAHTKVYAMVTEDEGGNRVWPSVLEEILIKLSHMAQDLPQIKNLSVNPVLLADKMAWCADARVELDHAAMPAPSNLIVSPYPEGHEVRAHCKEGLEVLLRPIRPEDADLVREFFSGLSSESVYFRFFRDMPEPSSQMLIRLTQVDYDREIALAAVWTYGLKEKLLGLCSLAQRPGSEWAEFAVIVEDHWQRHGIGKLLLTHMLEIARSRGQLRIMGMVLRQNRAMLELGRSVGFRADKPQNELVILRLELEGGLDAFPQAPN